MAHNNHVPLTNAQKQVASYQVLPSGEANFADIRQKDQSNHFDSQRTNYDPLYPNLDFGSGINNAYTSPIGFATPPSGTIALSGAQGHVPPHGSVTPSMIDHYYFSNAWRHKPQRLDETIQGGSTSGEFNTYIHYYARSNKPVEIPYISNLTIVSPDDLTDPYPLPYTFDVN